MKRHSYQSILSIARFDGSGGAGIQADIKTISELGCFATTVLTALPIQNTTGVKSIRTIPDSYFYWLIFSVQILMKLLYWLK